MSNKKESGGLQIYNKCLKCSVKQPGQDYPVGNRPDNIRHSVLETLVRSLKEKHLEYVEFHSGEGSYVTSNGVYNGSSVRALQVIATRQSIGDIVDFHAILHEIKDDARNNLERNVARFPATVRSDWRRYSKEYMRNSCPSWIVVSDPNNAEEYVDDDGLLTKTLISIIQSGSATFIYVPQQTDPARNATLHSNIVKDLTEAPQITQHYLDLVWPHLRKGPYVRKDHCIIFAQGYIFPFVRESFLAACITIIPSPKVSITDNRVEFFEQETI